MRKRIPGDEPLYEVPLDKWHSSTSGDGYYWVAQEGRHATETILVVGDEFLWPAKPGTANQWRKIIELNGHVLPIAPPKGDWADAPWSNEPIGTGHYWITEPSFLARDCDKEDWIDNGRRLDGLRGLRVVFYFGHDDSVSPILWPQNGVGFPWGWPSDGWCLERDRLEERWPYVEWAYMCRPRNPLSIPRSSGDASRCVGLPADVLAQVPR